MLHCKHMRSRSCLLKTELTPPVERQEAGAMPQSVMPNFDWSATFRSQAGGRRWQSK